MIIKSLVEEEKKIEIGWEERMKTEHYLIGVIENVNIYSDNCKYYLQYSDLY